MLIRSGPSVRGMAQIRPTQADPRPAEPRDLEQRVAEARAMPPDLGDNSVALVNGSTFMNSAPNGDVPPGSIGGLVHLDTRVLNRWVLRINGAPMLVLRSAAADPYSAQFFTTNSASFGLREETVAARRLRYLGDGLHERNEITCYCPEPVKLSTIKVTPPPDRLDGDDLVWVVEIAPHTTWRVDLHVPFPPGTEMPNRVTGVIQPLARYRPTSRFICMALGMPDSSCGLQLANASAHSEKKRLWSSSRSSRISKILLVSSSLASV